MDNKKTWEFGTRDLMFGAIGAVAYSLVSLAANRLAYDNISLRPAVAVLIFFGVAYGPWVGLLAGLFGSIFGDALNHWGVYWNWSLASGLIGLVAGLAMKSIDDLRVPANIIKAVGWGAAGIAAGVLFGAVTQKFISAFPWDTTFSNYFAPVLLGHLIVTIILLPVLMIAFAGVVRRSRK